MLGPSQHAILSVQDFPVLLLGARVSGTTLKPWVVELVAQNEWVRSQPGGAVCNMTTTLCHPPVIPLEGSRGEDVLWGFSVPLQWWVAEACSDHHMRIMNTTFMGCISSKSLDSGLYSHSARVHSYQYWTSSDRVSPYVNLRQFTSLYYCCSIAQSCLTLCQPMDCSKPGFPVLHYLLELAQTHVCWVDDATQPSHPLLAPSPPAFNLSQHQGLFKWVSSLHQVAKVLELQFQHQSFQRVFRIDFL